MNDNPQEKSLFDLNLNRDVYSKEPAGSYDKVNIAELLGTGSISGRQISDMEASKIKFVLDGVQIGNLLTINDATLGKSIGIVTEEGFYILSQTNSSFGIDNDIALDANDDIVLEGNNFAILRTNGTANQLQLLAQNGSSSIVLAAGGDVGVFESNNVTITYNSDVTGGEVTFRTIGNTRMRITDVGNVTADGTFVGGGADVAEMFESVDGKKIPKGTSIVLIDGKVREAKKGEKPFGVISTNPGLIGNAGGEDADTNWQGKYLKNELGEYIMEDADFWSIRKQEKGMIGKIVEKIKPKKLVECATSGWCDQSKPPKNALVRIKSRKKINPEWKADQKYVSRLNRDEWCIVGLMGVVPVRENQEIAEHWVKLPNNKYFIFPK